MRFKDPIKWADTEIELQADEVTREYLRVFLKWFTEAEEYTALTPAAAVRRALVSVETTDHQLSVEWIGQMLSLATEHWECGGEMFALLTVLERRMIEQMNAIRLAVLEESAKQ